MNNGIHKPGGDYWDWQVDYDGPSANPAQRNVPDNETQPRALIVDRHGKALISTGRRPLGFRPPR